MGNIVQIEKSEYCIDFPTIEKVSIDLDDYAFFYLENRLRDDWYLCHYIRVPVAPYFLPDSYKDFCLSSPADAAVILGQKLKGYRSIHSNDNFPLVLSKLLERIIKIKEK